MKFQRTWQREKGLYVDAAFFLTKDGRPRSRHIKQQSLFSRHKRLVLVPGTIHAIAYCSTNDTKGRVYTSYISLRILVYMVYLCRCLHWV